MGRDDPAGGSDLPAPYRNPWAALADDLRAVVADLGLRARELRRRNSEGSLWRPSWWPGDLAPLFWPLLLTLAIAVVVGLALGLQQVLPPQRDPAPTVSEPPSRRTPSLKASAASTQALPFQAPALQAPALQARAQRTAGDPAAPGSSGASGGLSSQSPLSRLRRSLFNGERTALPDVRSDQDTPKETPAETPAVTSAETSAETSARKPERASLGFPADPAATTPAIVPGTPTGSSPATGADRASSAAVADPLAALLSSPEADGWIEAAQARADQGVLLLQLAPAYGRLSVAERQRLALRWQGMAAELGYEHLELRDSRAGLLGRDALVGEGMILFSPSPPA